MSDDTRIRVVGVILLIGGGAVIPSLDSPLAQVLWVVLLLAVGLAPTLWRWRARRRTDQ